eukprot:1142649_1
MAAMATNQPKEDGLFIFVHFNMLHPIKPDLMTLNQPQKSQLVFIFIQINLIPQCDEMAPRSAPSLKSAFGSMVTDFGLSGLHTGGDEVFKTTLGSPNYVAPEVLI